MTLQELFIAEKMKAKPLSPAAIFIEKLARITGKTEVTVRQWISGKVIPDKLIQEAISRGLGRPASELFPIAKPKPKRRGPYGPRKKVATDEETPEKTGGVRWKR